MRDDNEAVRPMQLLLVPLALPALVLALRPRQGSGVAVSAILASSWAWIATAYHVAFFTPVNPVASVVAAVAALRAALFVWQGVVRRRLPFRWTGGLRSWTGAPLIAFALVVHPAWLSASGHAHPAIAAFGLPRPTPRFTIGLLAFAVPPWLRGPLLVPVLCCLVGAQAAFVLGVTPALGRSDAAVVGIGLVVRAKRSLSAEMVAVPVDAKAVATLMR